MNVCSCEDDGRDCAFLDTYTTDEIEDRIGLAIARLREETTVLCACRKRLKERRKAGQ